MSFNRLNRKVHYWTSFIIAVPLLVMAGSGVLLQLKKDWASVQPAELGGTGATPVLGLEDILRAVKTAPAMGVKSWNDVDRLDVRVGKGLVKVLLMNGWEVQVDLGTGRVMQTAYRRSDVIEKIHNGSIFAGDWTKLGIFLSAGVSVLLLWLGGMWMWWVPFQAKRAARARHAAHRAP